MMWVLEIQKKTVLFILDFQSRRARSQGLDNTSRWRVRWSMSCLEEVVKNNLEMAVWDQSADHIKF